MFKWDAFRGTKDRPILHSFSEEHVEAGLRPLRENDYSELSNMFFPATFTKRSCLRVHEATRRQQPPLRFLSLNDFFRRLQQVLFPSEPATALGGDPVSGRDSMSRRSFALPAATGTYVTERFHLFVS